MRDCEREIKAFSIKIINKYLDRDFNCIVLTSYRLVCNYSVANVNSFNSNIDCSYEIVDSYYKRFSTNVIKEIENSIIRVINIVRVVKRFIIRVIGIVKAVGIMRVIRIVRVVIRVIKNFIVRSIGDFIVRECCGGPLT